MYDVCDTETRVFDSTLGRSTLRIYAVKLPDGTLLSLADEPGDIRAHPIRLVARQREFVERMFRSEQPERVPHLNLNAPELTEADACAMIEMPHDVAESLAQLTAGMSQLDLQLPSHREQARKICSIADELAAASVAVPRLQRAAFAATATATAQIPSQPQFFGSSWGDGPFSFEEVSAIVKTKPTAGCQFHTDGGMTFSEYSAQMPAAAKEEEKLPDSAPAPVRRHLSWRRIAALFTVLLALVSRWMR